MFPPPSLTLHSVKEQEVRRACYMEGSSWVVAYLGAVGIPPCVVPAGWERIYQQPAGRVTRRLVGHTVLMAGLF